MRGLVYEASRDKVDVDTFHKGIHTHWKNQESRQYQNLKAKDVWALGTSLLIIPELRVFVLTKSHVGSGNEIGHHSVSSTNYLGVPNSANEPIIVTFFPFIPNLSIFMFLEPQFVLIKVFCVS